MHEQSRWLVAAVALLCATGPVRADSWTGFYGGVNAGGWNGNSVHFDGDDPNNAGAGNFLLNIGLANLFSFNAAHYAQRVDSNGFVGGGDFGYSLRLTKVWVAGVEADLQYSNVNGENATTGKSPVFPTVVTVNSEQDLKWFGTVRGRLGFLANEQILLFGTAGLAYGVTEANSSISTSSVIIFGNTSLNCPFNQVCIAGSDAKTSVGWTVGGGIEWAVWKQITLKAEYLHVDLGDQTIKLVAPPGMGNGFATAKFDNSFDVVRAGLNFQLN